MKDSIMFIRNIDELLQGGIVEFTSKVEQIIIEYTDTYTNDEEVKSKLVELRDACLQFPKEQMAILHPDYLTKFHMEDTSVDILTLKERVTDAINKTDILTLEKQKEYLELLDDLYNAYKKIEDEFKSIN